MDEVVRWDGVRSRVRRVRAKRPECVDSAASVEISSV